MYFLKTLRNGIVAFEKRWTLAGVRASGLASAVQQSIARSCGARRTQPSRTRA